MQVFLWWLGNFMIATLLVRGWRTGWWRTRRVFCAYLLAVLTGSLVALAVFAWRPQWYATEYWWSEMVYLVLGLAVQWELRSVVLAPYPGARRVSAVLIGPIVFCSWIALAAIAVAQPPMPATMAELERDIRFVQAMLLAAFVGIQQYFRVPIDANSKGIALGYGIFIGASLVNLTIWPHMQGAVRLLWPYLQPFAYLATLAVWCVTLWHTAPAESPAPPKTRVAGSLNTALDWIRL